MEDQDFLESDLVRSSYLRRKEFEVMNVEVEENGLVEKCVFTIIGVSFRAW